MDAVTAWEDFNADMSRGERKQTRGGFRVRACEVVKRIGARIVLEHASPVRSVVLVIPRGVSMAVHFAPSFPASGFGVVCLLVQVVSPV